MEESAKNVRISDVVTVEKLTELYVDKNMTAQRIAYDLGVDYGRLREFIKTHNIRKQNKKGITRPVVDVSSMTPPTINKRPLDISESEISNIDTAIVKLEQDLNTLRKAREILIHIKQEVK